MSAYTYEKVQLKAGRKSYILSKHNGEHWEGPAIEHFAKENATKIGLYSDDRKFQFEFAVLNPNGTEYTIKVCKDGYPSGPSIVVVDGVMYIGRYYAKDGFNGIVYRLKKGENVRIQDYKHGVLTKESEYDYVVQEDVATKIPFDCAYECSVPSIRKVNVNGVICQQFIAGDYAIDTQYVLAASIDEQQNVVIGQYRNKNFDGFVMEYTSNTNTCGFSFYNNGKKTTDYSLLYQPEIGGYALILPNADGGFTDFVYREKDKKNVLSIIELDKKLQPTKNVIDLPTEVHQSKTVKSFGFITKDLPTKKVKGITATQKLEQMIGLSKVKDEVAKLKAIIAKNPAKTPTLNIAFMGNPGTGKTVVARLFAQILFEIGALPTNKVVEVDRSGLVADYVGHTAIKTHEVVKSAMGGVLFIDEAYSLSNGGKQDFGKEAIDALISDMENYKGKMCFIFAGYKQPLLDMIDTNKGFKSRINRFFEFSNYTQDELRQIAVMKLESDGYHMSDNVLDEAIKIVSKRMYADDFGNAREVRNLLEKLYEFQAARTISQNKKDMEITMADIAAYNKKDEPEMVNNLTAEERLNNLIGLSNVKKEILKMKAILSKFKGNLDKTNLHMCFYGNPGTGKTEVARLLANILYDEGILPENKFIETDRSGLVAEHIGQTAIKTHKRVKDALGGVLFIDEAYSLANDDTCGFAHEAIDALIADMENYRGKICVILAGYEPQMEKMFAMNPGFKSRINRYITFPDYSNDELIDISKTMLRSKRYSITDDALNEIGKIIEAERLKPDFANARTIRNILESIYEIQALRTYNDDIADSWLIKACDVEEYELEHDLIVNVKEQNIDKQKTIKLLNNVTNTNISKQSGIDKIHIVKGNICMFNGDAIVNAANSSLSPGGGVCGAIFDAAGYKELNKECKKIGGCKTGGAVITKGLNLPSRYIIHAVGPQYGVDKSPKQLLAEAYRNSLKVAAQNGVRTIAFPSISTGIFGFPKEIAAPIALKEMVENGSHFDDIYVYCYDDSTFDIYNRALSELKQWSN